ncbi:putative Major facilitator superfamily (MFS) profile domain-containing protein [Seiridium cardinale]|uniref:Major facilitator superfamily (MFS) profile domain-containing protein n=1 Tax=Seiridium cardinale TaxID=138064 RepID=A0ABR2XB28_9PEZI
MRNFTTDLPMVFCNVSGATDDHPHTMARMAVYKGVHVIVGDCLSEMNIAWNAIKKSENPDLGYEEGFLAPLHKSLDDIVNNGIKVVTNAGALDTLSSTCEVEELCASRGHSHLVISAVFTNLRAQLITVPPYAAAYVVTLLVSWSADHFNARAFHSAVFATIGAVGFLVAALLPPDYYVQRYGCLIIATSGNFSHIPPLLSWLSSYLETTSAIGLAIALNISMSALGQIVKV